MHSEADRALRDVVSVEVFANSIDGRRAEGVDGEVVSSGREAQERLVMVAEGNQTVAAALDRLGCNDGDLVNDTWRARLRSSGSSFR